MTEAFEVERNLMADLSYLSADPALSGMPANLVTAARRSGASALDVYNAGGTPATNAGHSAAGMAMLQPGYHSPLDAPVAKPKFDIDNIATVKERINQIGNGIDPDAPAIMPNKQRRLELDQHFRDLNGILDHHALATAHQTHEDLINRKHTASANEYIQWAKGYNAIDTDRETYPLGSAERAQAIVGNILKYPDGASTKAAQEILAIDGPRHDTHAKIGQLDPNQRGDISRYNAMFKQAHQDASEYGRRYGVDVEYNDEGFPSVELTAAKAKARGAKPITPSVDDKILASDAKSRYDVPLADIRSPLAARSGNLDDKGNFVAANGGNAFQVDVLDKGRAGTVKTITIPRADYEKFGGKIGEADKVQGGKAAGPKPAIVKQGGVTYHLQEDGNYQ